MTKRYRTMCAPVFLYYRNNSFGNFDTVSVRDYPLHCSSLTSPSTRGLLLRALPQLQCASLLSLVSRHASAARLARIGRHRPVRHVANDVAITFLLRRGERSVVR